MQDVFYGGQRGGGKSDYLLGDYATRESKYGRNVTGLLVRRTYKELGDLIERSHEIYQPLGWKFVGGDELCWRSPRGALLRFRHLDTLDDARLYKGFNNQWLGCDEIDEWPDPRPLDLLFATLRSKHGVPCVRRCTGNPGGPGHAWIKRRYRPHLYRDGGPYVYTRYQPQPLEAPDVWVEAVYIPARIEDNPYIDVKEYEANLAIATAGSPWLYRAWRHSDWSVPAGAYFDIFDPAVHVTTRADAGLQPWHSRWISMDWGFKDDSAIHWHSVDEAKHVTTYREFVTAGKTPDVLGHMIAERCQIGVDEKNLPVYEKLDDFILSADAFGEKVSERTIADELGDAMESYGLPRPRRAIAGPRSRIPGWSLMYQMLQSGHWKMTKDCPDLIESLPQLARDPDDPEDCADHPRDHSPDSVRMGLTTFLKTVKEPVELQIDRMVTSVEPTERVFQIMRAQEKLVKRPQLKRQNKRRFF